MWVFGVWTAPFDHYSGSMVCPASIALLTTPRSLSAMPLSARECLPAAPQRTEFRSACTVTRVRFVFFGEFYIALSRVVRIRLRRVAIGPVRVQRGR